MTLASYGRRIQEEDVNMDPEVEARLHHCWAQASQRIAPTESREMATAPSYATGSGSLVQMQQQELAKSRWREPKTQGSER